MKKVMVFGTFDEVRPEDEELFRRARALAEDPFLIVSVARDSAVARFAGEVPEAEEDERLARVVEHELVDQAILGDEDGYVHHIVAAAPDIIALPDDQEGDYIANLKDDLIAAGVAANIVRLDLDAVDGEEGEDEEA